MDTDNRINRLSMLTFLKFVNLQPASFGNIVLIFTVAVNFLLFFGYPLNIAAFDYPNYLQMIQSGQSNLIHAPGYPLAISSISRVLSIEAPIDILDLSWIKSIQVMNFGILMALLITCHQMTLRLYGQRGAFAVCIFWGCNVLYISGANSAAPEWLQGALLALCILMLIDAGRSVGVRKLFLYIGASAIFLMAYLVKFNSLLLLPGFILFLFVDPISISRKIVIGVLSIAVYVGLLNAFVNLYHAPSTGTKQLSFDHAWVLIDAMPSAYFERPPEELGNKALMWRALNTIVPPDYFRANAYRDFNWGAPAIERAKYLEKFGELEKMSRSELIQLNYKTDLPSGYRQQVSAIPLYYYFGLEKTDGLGISVFKESLLRNPMNHLERAMGELNRFIWSDPYFTIPTREYPLRLKFDVGGSGFLGYTTYAGPDGTSSLHLPYWNPKQKVRSFALYWAEIVRSIKPPTWVYLAGILGASLCAMFACSSNTKKHFFYVVLACSSYFIGSFLLLGVRHKELVSIIPVMAIAAAICLGKGRVSIPIPSPARLSG